MRRLPGMLLALVCLPGAGGAQELVGAARWADSARREIEAANVLGDTARLAAVRVLLERALTAHPADALLLHYQGYAYYREANLRMGRFQQDAGPLLDGAQRALEASLQGEAMPETLALLSSVLGQKIGSNPIRGMTLGPRSSDLMERAIKLAPDNPRPWLLRGIGAIFTPGLFGGGLDRAEEYLGNALARFAQDSPAPPRPAWGRAETLVWLGQVHARRGRTEDARKAYVEALALEPENAWVREELLPALDRKR